MFYVSVALSFLVVAVCLWYLLQFSRPRLWWKIVLCFSGLAAIFLLPVIRFKTGWSLTYTYRSGWEIAVSFLAFFGLVSGFWVLGRDGLLDMVGKTISVLLLAVVFFFGRVRLVLLVTVLRGVGAGGYVSGGRLDATHSYELFDDQVLIGGGHFERCVVYRNPPWFPFIREQISDWPLDSPRAGDVYTAKAREMEYARLGIHLRKTK